MAQWIKASEKLPEGTNGYAKDIAYKVHRDSGTRIFTSTVNQFLDTVKYRVQEKYEWLDDSLPQEEQGWVSVEDRLPEIGEPVLVYAPTEEDKIQVDHRCKTGHESGWSWDWCMNTETFEHTVTHWQPLPAPPTA